MKYIPSVDQIMAIDFKLLIGDAHAFDLILEAQSWAKSIIVEGVEYYYLAQEKMVEEVPLYIGSVSAASRAIINLHKRGWIKKVTQGRKNYYRVESRVAQFWKKDNKLGVDYSDLYADFTNSDFYNDKNWSKNDIPTNGSINPLTFPRTGANIPTNGSINPLTFQRTGAIHKPYIHKPIKNKESTKENTPLSFHENEKKLSKIEVAKL
jgi:hypothetical protein